MKKLFAITIFAVGFCITQLNAENYKINDHQVDDLFVAAQDETSSLLSEEEMEFLSAVSISKGGESQTHGGYLVRAFFCGAIALHRYYMGASGEPLWAMYLCIPVAGGIAAFVDFWWVVFDADALKKYKGNNKFWVFTD